MIEYKLASTDNAAHDKLDMIFTQLREKAAKHRVWNVSYTKFDDGSATLEILFESPTKKSDQ